MRVKFSGQSLLLWDNNTKPKEAVTKKAKNRKEKL